MGAFLDSIFNRTYYKEVIASYELVNNKFYDGVRIDIWTHLMRGCIINYVH